jgi:hypothetical protein
VNRSSTYRPLSRARNATARHTAPSSAKKAPQVRISEAGGFYVKEPVLRHYSNQDFDKITRFYERGM